MLTVPMCGFMLIRILIVFFYTLMQDTNKNLIAQFAFYLAIGGVNTLLTAGIMTLLARAGAHYTLYTAMGYSAGFLSSYYWNSRLTFRAQAVNRHLLTQFLIANLCLLLLVQTLQICLIELIKIPELPSIIVGMAAYTLIGFGINRRLLTPRKKEI